MFVQRSAPALTICNVPWKSTGFRGKKAILMAGNEAPRGTLSVGRQNAGSGDFVRERLTPHESFALLKTRVLDKRSTKQTLTHEGFVPVVWR